MSTFCPDGTAWSGGYMVDRGTITIGEGYSTPQFASGSPDIILVDSDNVESLCDIGNVTTTYYDLTFGQPMPAGTYRMAVWDDTDNSEYLSAWNPVISTSTPNGNSDLLAGSETSFFPTLVSYTSDNLLPLVFILFAIICAAAMLIRHGKRVVTN